MTRLVRRPERGASAVEFAFVLLPLLYLVFGIIQYGLYFWGMQAGTSATSDAVRRMSVGDCTKVDPAVPNELQKFLDTRLGSASPSSAGSIVATPVFKDANGAPSTAVVGGSVTLTVKFEAIDLNFPFIPLPDDGEVTRTVFARVEDTGSTTSGCL